MKTTAKQSNINLYGSGKNATTTTKKKPKKTSKFKTGADLKV